MCHRRAEDRPHRPPVAPSGTSSLSRHGLRKSLEKIGYSWPSGRIGRDAQTAAVARLLSERLVQFLTRFCIEERQDALRCQERLVLLESAARASDPVEQ